MRNRIKGSAVIALLLILTPAPGVLANTSEEPVVEDSTEQPVSEESTEQQEYEGTTEESVEGNNTSEAPSNEYVPPQNEQSQNNQPQYEETTEAPYQSYEEPQKEFNGEQTAEETVEVFTEEVTVETTEETTAEPSEEVFTEPETVEERTEVTINQKAVDEFSITGRVVADDADVKDVTITLSGGKKDEAATDENGGFSFEGVPPGEYELHVEIPEGYTAEKETMSLNVEDRSKQGITFIMEEKPAEESVKTDERVMSEADESSNNMPIILVGAVLLAIVAILFAARALRK